MQPTFERTPTHAARGAIDPRVSAYAPGLEAVRIFPKNWSMGAELSSRVSVATVIRECEPMARKTTLRVGGPADIFVEPASERDLSETILFCAQRSLPFFVLGRGSNLLVKDKGFRGMVISMNHESFTKIEVDSHTMTCGAGAKLKSVAMEARRQNITGLEFLEGIPGTVGGALRMNAGAMGGATFDLVRSIRVMDFSGKVLEKRPSDITVNYRSCSLLKNHIALAAEFGGRIGLRENIEETLREFCQKRWKSQPAAPSAGCIFKNPPSISAGKLIDDLGLKGTRVGGARVSAEHGNFIVNDESATAANVLELIEIVRQRARAERGIELETEVEIIGE
jgi:UDP-N-acetylenolpyruvoylglucosamine reductase